MDYSPGIINIDRAERIMTISTDKDVHFTGAIGLNQIEYEDIPGLPTNKITIRGVNIQAEEARLYTLWLWKSSTHANSDLDVDSFRDFINLDVATSGKRIAGSGQWYLQSSNLCILYEDDDPPTAEGYYTLHLGLMVSAGGSKSAGKNIQIDIMFSPRL
ncbi:hypothetical protein DRN97_02535 [Methanosarcinales archaeon]|nr:MAG: hypothetical protein DRN97_02535 [Methanosarcinales archaeon]